jgi:hypothetical protein
MTGAEFLLAVVGDKAPLSGVCSAQPGTLILTL